MEEPDHRLLVTQELSLHSMFGIKFGMAGCHVAEIGGSQLPPALVTKVSLKCLFVQENFFKKFVLQFVARQPYSVLLLSPPKGDLPPMGGMLVKMPPKCPP